MEITREIAENILSKQVEIRPDMLGEQVKGIRVGGISYTDEHGEPWTYDRSGEQYAIVNLRAMSTEQLDEAEVLLDSDPQMAVRKNLSISMSPEKASQFATGMLVEATFDTYVREDESEATICTSIVKQASITARPNRFARAKANAKTNTEDAPKATETATEEA